jgi:hypothetical protein
MTLHRLHAESVNFTFRTIDNTCQLDYVTRFSLANARFHRNYSDIVDVMAFNSTLMMMGYLLYFRFT